MLWMEPYSLEVGPCHPPWERRLFRYGGIPSLEMEAPL